MTAVARKRNVPGYTDELGRFRPIRSASFVGSGSSRRPAKVRDRKKYSKAKAGDLGKVKQERALEDVFDRQIRLDREAAAAQKKHETKLQKEIEADVYGHTSDAKAQTLAQFVRAAGGIRRTFKHDGAKFRGKRSGWDSGEIDRLTRKGSGSSGLTTSRSDRGKTMDYMFQAARESGYDVTSIDDMMERIENEVTGGKPTYPTHGSLSYNPKSPSAARLAKAAIAVFDEDLDLDLDAKDVRILEKAKRKKQKTNPDLLSMFANGAVGIASALQIKEYMNRPKRKAAAKQRGTTKAKANPVRRSTPKPPADLLGEFYLMPFAAGGNRKPIVQLCQGTNMYKEFPTAAAARAFAAKHKIRLAANPTPKKNGILSRALARRKAGREYKRELRLEAAAERSRARRRKAEAKAKGNPHRPLTAKELRQGAVLTKQLEKITDQMSGLAWGSVKRRALERRYTVIANKVSAIGRIANPPTRHTQHRRTYESFQGRPSTQKRELRLEAAAERSRRRRQKAEQAARSNPNAQGTYRLKGLHGLLGGDSSGFNTLARAKQEAKLKAAEIGETITILRRGVPVGKVKHRVDRQGYSLGHVFVKANPRRSASGKTAVARAVNGKKAVTRSAKVNPTPRCSCGHIREGHVKEVGKCSLCTCRKFKRKAFKTLKAVAAAMRTAPARKNPKTTARRRTFEMFQGRQATTARPMIVSRHAPAKLDQLGDLVAIKIMGQPEIRFNGKGTKLCAAGGKLWIAGKRFAKPNPAAPANEINPIGEIDHIVYGTYKPHHGDHAYTHYIHKLGEESGKMPTLCVDREGYPVIRGGNYKIEARGIVD